MTKQEFLNLARGAFVARKGPRCAKQPTYMVDSRNTDGELSLLSGEMLSMPAAWTDAQRWCSPNEVICWWGYRDWFVVRP